MKLLTSEKSKFLDVGTILIDLAHYIKFKESFYRAFNEMRWTPSVEFKGKFLFS